MLITRSVTKKILETLVHDTFSNYGKISSAALLDSLKLLGFYYATNAAISINIEDLKTPEIKEKFLEKAEEETQWISQEWAKGQVSDSERFQSIIDSWNIATESLKARIVYYYQTLDPTNNLYIMAFSGARGNMSQVRQLVGMRGLMSDQEGKIIDLPIQANFREGLSSIDYIISSYGARKGIVDTALKTADSGYLTRRLIYVAQDLVIRQVDCQTKKGLLLRLKRETPQANFLGRTAIWSRRIEPPFDFLEKHETVLTPEKFQQLQREAPSLLNLRSILTCEATNSICQKCYGWDLAQQKPIALGEAVGILAAQSIGEPGTQLTMRTFHTGGIFTNETVKQIVAPFTGRLIFPPSLRTVPYRTNHGTSVLKLQQEATFILQNWKGEEKAISLEIGSYLYFSKTSFLLKGQIIAEYSTQAPTLATKRAKPLYSRCAGEVKFEGLAVRRRKTENTRRLVTSNEGTIWITAGQVLSVPSELQFQLLPNQESWNLKKQKAFGRLKITTPIHGIVSITEKSFVLTNADKKIQFSFGDFRRQSQNCSIQLVPLVRNYQYVDPLTVIGFVYFFPKIDAKIYKIRESYRPLDCQQLLPTLEQDKSKLKRLRKSKQKLIQNKGKKYEILGRGSVKFSMITSKDVWHITTEQPHSNLAPKTKFVRAGMPFSQTATFTRSGFLLEQKGKIHYYQDAIPLFVGANTIVNYHLGEFLEEKTSLGILMNSTQQTEDIVQGLPKIEELVEARRPKEPCILSKRPGIVLKPSAKIRIFPQKDLQKITVLKRRRKLGNTNKEQKLYLFHSPSFKQLKIATQGMLFEGQFLPPFFNLSYAKKERKNKKPTTYKDEYTNTGKVYRLRLGNRSSINIPLMFEQWLEGKTFNSAVWNRAFRWQENRVGQKTKVFTEDLKKEFRKLKSGSSNHAMLLTSDLEWLQINKHYNWKWIRCSNDFFIFPQNSKQVLPIPPNLEKNQKIPAVPSCQQFPVLSLYKSRKNKGMKKSPNLKYRRLNFRLSYLAEMADGNHIYLEENSPVTEYKNSQFSEANFQPGEFVDLGQPLTQGKIDIHEFLKVLFQYHSYLDGSYVGTMKSLTKFQLILVNSIQAIYDSQGVTIASKHIDTIVRQMTSKVIVEDGGDSPFLPGELVSLALMNQVILGFQKVHETNEQSKLSITYKLPNYQPNLLSITNSALMKQGFLSSAGFQETRRILSTAAIEGRSDWLRGLKESVIIGRLIPAGTSFFNYRNNLDLFYQKKLRNRGIKIQLPLADELNSLENQENLEEKRKEILERKYKAIQNSKETETSLSSVK